MQRQTFTELRKILVDLYPDSSDARRLIHDAGLPADRISFSSSPANVWNSILQEAEKTNLLTRLIQTVADEYSTHSYQLFRLLDNEQKIESTRATGKDKTSQTISPSHTSFDQRGQTVYGPQTNIAGNVNTSGGIFVGRDRHQEDIIGANKDKETESDEGIAGLLLYAEQSNRTGLQLQSSGDYEAALPYLEKALDIRQNVLGLQHLATADSLNNLANLLQVLGNFSVARAYYEQALAVRLALLGENHPDTALCLNNLGALLQEMGDFTQAMQYYEQALVIRRSVLGDNHLDTALSLNNLGALLQAEGNYEAAKSYYEQALTIRLEILGEQHPDTAITFNNLGVLLQAMDDYTAAKSYYERALAVRLEIFGKHHPDTASSLNNLGELFRLVGEYNLALSNYEQALTIYTSVLGNAHPTIANIYNNLGLLQVNLKNYSSAKSYFEQALDIYQSVLGEKHPDIAYTFSNLGLLYTNLGNFDSAQQYLERALVIYSSLLGDHHPDTLRTLEMLVALTTHMGHYQNALSYSHHLLVTLRTIGNRRAEAQVLNQLAALNIRTGDYVTAQKFAQSAHTISEEINAHELVGTALVNLAEIMVYQGELEEARRWGDRALTMAKAHEIRPIEGRALNVLGLAAYSLGQITLATPYLQEALIIARETQERQLEGEVLGNLAQVYGNFGREREAVPYYTQAIHIVQELNDSRKEKELLASLGTLYNNLNLYTEAVGSLSKAIKLVQEQHDMRNEGNYHGSLATAYYGLEQYDSALSAYQNAIDIMRSLSPEDRRGISYHLGNMGDTYTKMGRLEDAVRSYTEALKLAYALSDRRRQQLYLENLAECYLILGQVDDVLQYYTQLVDLLLSSDRRQAADILLKMGTLARDYDRSTQARQFWSEARTIYSELQLPHAQSVDSLLADLATSETEPLSLVEITQQYMAKSGFDVTLSSTSTSFVCQPVDVTWLNYTRKPIPVKVLSGMTLEMEMVLNLVEESAQILGETPHYIIVVCDQAPTDAAWLQIAAYRSNGINIMPVDDSILRTGLQHNQHHTVLFNHLEDRYLGPHRDLYDRHNPISDRFNFFGRAPLADQLTATLQQGHTIAIFGLRKMGKSSLLNYMRDRLPYPAAVIDLQAGTNLQEIYKRIIRAWQDRLRTLQPELNWQLPEPLFDDTPSTHFSRTVLSLLDTLTKAEAVAQVAVFVDEIELIYPHTEPKLTTYLNFARTLRGLAQEQLGRFGLIVAGVDPNIVRTNRLFGQQNPFFSFFHIQYLPPLNTDDCRQMIRNIGTQMGLTYEDAAVDFIAEVSGGHPFWARKLCSLAFQNWKRQGGKGKMTHQQITTTAQRFVQHPNTAQLPRGLWGDVTDRQLWSDEDATANEAILLALAESEQCTRTDLLAQAAKPATYQRSLIELDDRAIIDEVATDAFWIHLHLFRSWIRTDKLGKE